jgi:hypothetical protein
MRKVGWYRHIAGEVDASGNQCCDRCGLLLSLPRERRFQPGQQVASQGGHRLRFHVPASEPVLTCWARQEIREIPRPVSPFDPSRFADKAPQASPRTDSGEGSNHD